MISISKVNNRRCLVLSVVTLLVIAGGPLRAQTDTALYDLYGMNRHISQPVRLSLQHAMVGATAALTVYGVLIVNDRVHDDMGIGFLVMPILGGGMGFLSGLVTGLIESGDPGPHPKPFVMYRYGYGFLPASNTDRIDLSIPILRHNGYPYLPEEISLRTSFSSWWLADRDAKEFQFGLEGRSPITTARFVSTQWGIGAGISKGESWYNGTDEYRQFSRREDDKRRFVTGYLHCFAGADLNMFDFFHLTAEVVAEPVNAALSIRPRSYKPAEIFYVRFTAGPTIE